MEQDRLFSWHGTPKPVETTEEPQPLSHYLRLEAEEKFPGLTRVLGLEGASREMGALLGDLVLTGLITYEEARSIGHSAIDSLTRPEQLRIDYGPRV